MQPLAYLVTSHYSYAPLTLPRILPSLMAAGIAPEQVFVLVGGCDRELEVRGPQCTFWYLPHHSRTFSAYLEAASESRRNALAPFQHMFLLMDTCEAGPWFKNLSEHFDRSLDACGGTPHGDGRTMSDIGAYRIEYLRKNPEVGKYWNHPMDMGVSSEGEMFLLAEKKAYYGGQGGVDRIMTPSDRYGTGTPRITEYFTQLDLWKYKSNWGQLPIAELNERL